MSGRVVAAMAAILVALCATSEAKKENQRTGGVVESVDAEAERIVVLVGGDKTPTTFDCKRANFTEKRQQKLADIPDGQWVRIIGQPDEAAGAIDEVVRIDYYPGETGEGKKGELGEKGASGHLVKKGSTAKLEIAGDRTLELNYSVKCKVERIDNDVTIEQLKPKMRVIVIYREPKEEGEPPIARRITYLTK